MNCISHFHRLPKAKQKYAKLFLHHLQRGDAQLIEGHIFRDYINTYKDNAENAQLNAGSSCSWFR